MDQQSKAARMPNFLIIGVAKAGTTSMYEYLKQHPQIYMSPVKEPKFFAFENMTITWTGPGAQESARKYITKLEDYQRLFLKAGNAQAVGEATPWYVYSPKAAERIKAHIPRAKIIAILRDPVDRAYSNFKHMLGLGREPLASFTDTIAAEPDRMQKNWGWSWYYFDRGRYYENILRYYKLFDRNQLQIFLYEDFSGNPLDLLRKSFGFLEVDPNFEPDVTVRYNVRDGTKNTHDNQAKPGIFTSVMKHLSPRKNFTADIQVPSKCPPEIRYELVKRYKNDILHLQDLIERDLSSWME